MNSVQTSAPGASPETARTGLARWAGSMSILQGLLLFIPLTVLGAAIDWPGSLSDPADIALPRLLENEAPSASATSPTSSTRCSSPSR